MWVQIISMNKISYRQIRDPRFNPSYTLKINLYFHLMIKSNYQEQNSRGVNV